MNSPESFDVVVPSVGRPSLRTLLDALAASTGPLPTRLVLVDDRRTTAEPLFEGPPPAALADRLVVLRSGGRGPAAARNTGWRAARSEWVAFLDDDVVPPASWTSELVRDLTVPDAVGASVGRITVPLPAGRRHTDWERNVAGLETARWATADMAYRRSALLRLGGFDERFPRAYREDADLALRTRAAGLEICLGDRRVLHPVRPAGRWVSIRLQAGNADDALMRAVHGPDWRERAGVPRGRRPWHLATTAAGVIAVLAGSTGRWRIARLAAAGWALLTAEFAARRIAPGPRDRDEVLTMLATSALIPPAATYHWLRGWAGVRRLLAAGGPVPQPARLPAAVLLDRDGTLIRDVPYNGDPALVEPLPGVAAALRRIRSLGIPVAVVTNQSGVARGLLSVSDVDAVNERVEQLLGPFDGFFVCPHGVDDNCSCRKPQPELLLKAAAQLGVEPADCVMVGDIGADVAAAQAAAMRAILVPTAVTRRDEVRTAPHVALDFESAVDVILAGAS